MARGRECLRKLRAHMMATPEAPPEIVDDEVVIRVGGVESRYACGASTGYKSTRAAIGVYTLEAVVLLLRTAKSSDYLKLCLSKGLKGVVLGDQGDLKAYVSGGAEDSAQLEDDVDGGEVVAAAEAAAAPVEAPTKAAPMEVDDGGDAGDDGKEDYSKYFDAGVSIYDRNHGLMNPGKDYTFAAELWDRFRKEEKKELLKRKEEKAKEKERVERDLAAGRDPKKRKRDEEKKKAHEEKKAKLKAEAKAGAGEGKTVGIIIVPNAMTSIVTLLNVADLLEKSQFHTVAEKRAAGAKKETSVKITRTAPDGTLQTFKIIDNPTRLIDSDWRRVVAVVAMGAAWQFKGWKYGKPVDIFNRFLGIHLKFEDVDTNPEVKKWNVSVLTINKFKRHLDPTTVVQFWRLLDDFLEKRKKAIAGMKARKK